MSCKMSRRQSEQSFLIPSCCNDADIESEEKERAGGSLNGDASYPVAATGNFTHTQWLASISGGFC